MPVTADERYPSSQPFFRAYATIGAILGWLTLAIQLYLILLNRTVSAGETIVRYFSYFTILSNILAALSFTYALLPPAPGNSRFFTKSLSLSAITVYITIVGLVYNIILRPLWDPKGWQKFVDESLHSVVPLLFIFFWWLFIPKKCSVGPIFSPG